MNKSKGFTVIELIVVIVFLSAAGILFFVQKNNIEVANRDMQRKTAINAMYYALEESFYKTNNYYPAEINETNLKTVAPELFNDPSENTINEEGSDYRYDTTGCVDEKCSGYTLRADLENEADFIKTNRNN